MKFGDFVKKLNEEQEVNEAARGTPWYVKVNYDDPSGTGIASLTKKVYAPTKEHAKRYAEADCTKMGKENVKAVSAKSLEEDLNEATQSEEGAIPETEREEDLAKKHGNRKRITFGDVLKARQESARKKEMKEDIEHLDELKQETYKAARQAIAKKMGELTDDTPDSYHPWPSMMKKQPKTDMSKEAQLGKLAQSFARAAAGEGGRRPVKRIGEEIEELDEVLSKSAPIEDWIHDFVHSDNPKFKGKTKEERRKMAIAAYYAAHGK